MKKTTEGDELRYFYCIDGSEDLNCENYRSVMCQFISFNKKDRVITVRLKNGVTFNTTLFHIQGFIEKNK